MPEVAPPPRLLHRRRPTFFVHTPANDDALGLARRFHDEVRAQVPTLAPLPTPIETGPARLF